ncbi:MAG: hypothetical protein PWQ72_364 [Pseudothermotoga sp.]|jgi:predicted short-subunit dehydrogenase-like oxidoreductase (DUF2520 family)|nr:MAG: Uncharacterized protein XD56_0101 [Pseudothermotoga lettingae]MDI3494237.1 hypothetical protein [Pseudothermotoga sp.]MDK2883989.1 hypothetical protein [Pseudothermotoga sp.]
MWFNLFGDEFMNINVVGTSKVAFVLCKILLEEDFSIGCVVSRSKQRAEDFVAKIGQGFPKTYEEDFTLKGVTFFAVPDQSISEVYHKLKNRLEEASAFHFSGFLDSEIFKDFDQKGWARGSIHPNLSFADEENALKYIKTCCFGIEGNREGLLVAKQIVEKISNCWVEIPYGSKGAYHLAAVIASNFNVALAYLSEKLYKLYNIKGFQEVIPKLMMSSVHNILKKGVQKSLTGPVAREDWLIVEKEREIFVKTFPEYKKLYDDMIDILIKIKGEVG